ncbi:MAG: hypothetical protein AAF543_08320 [Pseudomonadota bacterium]
MLPSLRATLSAAVIATGALMVQASDASASIFYSWTGDCTRNCSGTSSATLELRDSYNPGTAVTRADFRSFSYSSTVGPNTYSYTVGRPQLANYSTAFRGTLPASGGAGNAEVWIDFDNGGTYHFTRDNNAGRWESWYSPAGIYNHRGRNSNWSVNLPAPGSLLALAGALAVGLVVYRGRRRPEEETGALA